MKNCFRAWRRGVSRALENRSKPNLVGRDPWTKKGVLREWSGRGKGALDRKDLGSLSVITNLRRWRVLVSACGSAACGCGRRPVTCLSVLGFLSMLSAAEGPSNRSAMGSVLSSDPALKAVLPMTRGFETCDQLAEIVADCRKQLESMQGWKVCKSALSACLVYALAL